MPTTTSRTAAGLLLGLLLLIPGTAGAAASEADPSITSLNRQKILEFANAERAGRGLPLLNPNQTLDGLAQAWAENLAVSRRSDHNPTVPALGAGFPSAAENLAWGTSLNAAQAHGLWMAGDAPRKSLLDPAFSDAGVGIACSTASGRPFVVAVLELGGHGAPTSDVPAAGPRAGPKESTPGRSVSCGETDASAASAISSSTLAAVPPDAAPAALSQPEPQPAAASGKESSALLAAAAAIMLVLALVALKGSAHESRIAAAILNRPRLNTRQMADLLEDYRLD